MGATSSNHPSHDHKTGISPSHTPCVVPVLVTLGLGTDLGEHRPRWWHHEVDVWMGTLFDEFYGLFWGLSNRSSRDVLYDLVGFYADEGWVFPSQIVTKPSQDGGLNIKNAGSFYCVFANRSELGFKGKEGGSIGLLRFEPNHIWTYLNIPLSPPNIRLGFYKICLMLLQT